MRLRGAVALSSWGELAYWWDSAAVVGEETLLAFTKGEGGGLQVSRHSVRKVRGWAFDGGVTWQTPFPGHPALTLGYAIGSGDEQPQGETDFSFRQTGLQDNNGRFRGVDRFRYYGELLRPELSNLQIWTAALGMRFWRSSSVEFLYHLYYQVEEASILRGARIKADPQGTNRNIGQEWTQCQ